MRGKIVDCVKKPTFYSSAGAMLNGIFFVSSNILKVFRQILVLTDVCFVLISIMVIAF